MVSDGAPAIPFASLGFPFLPEQELIEESAPPFLPKNPSETVQVHSCPLDRTQPAPSQRPYVKEVGK